MRGSILAETKFMQNCSQYVKYFKYIKYFKYLKCGEAFWPRQNLCKTALNLMEIPKLFTRKICHKLSLSKYNFGDIWYIGIYVWNILFSTRHHCHGHLLYIKYHTQCLIYDTRHYDQNFFGVYFITLFLLFCQPRPMT